MLSPGRAFTLQFRIGSSMLVTLNDAIKVTVDGPRSARNRNKQPGMDDDAGSGGDDEYLQKPLGMVLESESLSQR